MRPARTPALNEIYKQNGQRIRARRRGQGMTQRQLGDAIGVSPQLIHQIEKGINAVSMVRLSEIAEALHVPPAAFFHNNGDPNASDDLPGLLDQPDAIRMARAFKAVSGKQRGWLIEVVEACANRCQL